MIYLLMYSFYYIKNAIIKTSYKSYLALKTIH